MRAGGRWTRLAPVHGPPEPNVVCLLWFAPPPEIAASPEPVMEAGGGGIIGEGEEEGEMGDTEVAFSVEEFEEKFDPSFHRVPTSSPLPSVSNLVKHELSLEERMDADDGEGEEERGEAAVTVGVEARASPDFILSGEAEEAGGTEEKEAEVLPWQELGRGELLSRIKTSVREYPSGEEEKEEEEGERRRKCDSCKQKGRFTVSDPKLANVVIQFHVSDLDTRKLLEESLRVRTATALQSKRKNFYNVKVKFDDDRLPGDFSFLKQRTLSFTVFPKSGNVIATGLKDIDEVDFALDLFARMEKIRREKWESKWINGTFSGTITYHAPLNTKFEGPRQRCTYHFEERTVYPRQDLDKSPPRVDVAGPDACCQHEAEGEGAGVRTGEDPESDWWPSREKRPDEDFPPLSFCQVLARFKKIRCGDDGQPPLTEVSIKFRSQFFPGMLVRFDGERGTVNVFNNGSYILVGVTSLKQSKVLQEKICVLMNSEWTPEKLTPSAGDAGLCLTDLSTRLAKEIKSWMVD